MDINAIRILFTLVSFAIFIGIVVWAVSPGKQKDFADAAQIPLGDGD